MKKLLALLLLAPGISVQAQLYVSPTAAEGSYMYVSDTYVYVDQDVNLVTNSTASSLTTSQYPSIILRNQAQLLQGNGVSQDNDGSGDLSVYQEGTSDGFVYNFWCSPVGLTQISGTTEAIGNTDFAFRTSGQNIYKPNSEAISDPATIIVPTGGFNGSTSNGGSLDIASFWLFKFQGGGATASYIPVWDTGTVEPGYGFTMKGIDGTDNTTVNAVQNNSGQAQRYDFKGRPHNGTITVPIAASDNVLAGNPYPSAFDLSYFLLQNSLSGAQFFDGGDGDPTNDISFTATPVLTGTASFWDQRDLATHFIEEYEGGFGVFSPMGDPFSLGVYTNAAYFMFDEDGNQSGGPTGNSGSSYDRRFSPIGQGFFVQSVASPAAGSFTISNDHRIYVREGTNSDFRSVDPHQQIQPIVGVKTNYQNTDNFYTTPQIHINAIVNDTYNRELAVAFSKRADYGYDVAMDAKTRDNISTDVSFIIDNEEKFVVNAIQAPKGRLPLYVEAASQTVLTVYVNYMKGLDIENVYLLDKLTGSYHHIVGEKVELILDQGVYSGRFFITFEKYQYKDIAENEEVAEVLNVFNAITAHQNNQRHQLEVINPQQAELTQVEVFDVAGKLIFASQQLGDAQLYTFPTHYISTGIYIVRMQTQEGLTKSRKIRIHN